MTRDHVSDTHLLPVLIAGFTLLFLLLVASGFVAFQSMRFIESDAARLVAEQQATVRLIAEMQSEEGNLSIVFYSLAAGRNRTDPGELLKRLDALESAIRRTTDAGMASPDSILWNKVRKAAEAFIAEGRDALRSNRPSSEEFFQRHQNLLAALADLTSSNFIARNEAQKAESERASRRIRDSLILLGTALGIAIVGAFFTVNSVNRAVRSLRWQATELKHLSSRVMSDQEETSRRLATEMHDHLGQMLSAIEANLVAMQHAQSFHAGRLEDCLGILKDAVESMREVSQLLRPSILDDFGLSVSLRWLADRFSDRTGVPAQFESSFDRRLSDEQETQLFRIAQEALTNITRHSKATQVELQLSADKDALRLLVSDNGQGMPAKTVPGGLGLVGMRARARTAGGSLRVHSSPGQGVRIVVEIPNGKTEYVSQG
ncbi:MAG: sensor histidine kinase [Acidobacteriia bacterium]|nr:sensor histidine kinase [Terriglobia bacterium]